MENFFRKRIGSADALKPYMVAGTLERERKIGTGESAESLQDEFLAEAISELSCARFHELDNFSVGGMGAKWTLFSSDAPQYASGRYYVTERLALMPIYTELESPIDQTVTLDVYASRFALIVNGETVFDNKDIYYRPRKRVYVFEHARTENVERVTFDLKCGKNVLIFLCVKYNRSTGMTFASTLTDCREAVYATVPIGMDDSLRQKVLMSERRTYMVDTEIKYGTEAKLHVGALDTENAYIELQLEDKTVIPTEEYYVFPKYLPVKSHKFKVFWKSVDGGIISEKEYSFGIYNVFPPAPGFSRFGERRKKSLEHLAAKGEALALYRLGRESEISIDRIDALCSKIKARQDCSDFELLPLLMLAFEDRSARKLAPRIHELIKDAALSFRYWVDEPGTSSMFYCSENHRIGFHVCEYIAGLLYPTDIFENTQQNGMYHSLKGRMHLVEWLNQRCRMGFDEPHSDCYLPVTFGAILALREVLPLEEYPLRNMVNILLDFMTFIFATSNFDGVMATPRARSYNSPLRTSLCSASSMIFWMLFGNCEAPSGGISRELAFSLYVPPRALCELAEDYSPATFHFKEGIMHFDKHNADFTIRRTPDYMLGGVRDHNVGMCDMHFVSAFCALKGDISIFFSAPDNDAEGNGLRPDYWAGQAFLPRVLTHGRTLAVIWHNVNNPKIWMTHAYFNTNKFDEVRRVKGITFGRKETGYVAIYSKNPHYISEEGKYSARELIAPGRDNVWIAMMGSESEDGSFDSFIERISATDFHSDSLGMSFIDADGELFEFGYTDGFKIGGEEVKIPEYLCYSPYLKSKFGSGKFEYDCGDMKETLWSYPASV